MSEQSALKIMKCPTCGAPLKAQNNTDAITCVYCGNTIVPVQEAAPKAESPVGGFSGVVRVEGIKTSSSALAYMEQFFEEYDWEAFAYAQTLSVGEMDKLVASLKVSSADDKSTWLACFKAISVPFAHKIDGCRQILASVIEEYTSDNLDAYSTFDAYKRVSAVVNSSKAAVLENLEKIAANAARYGADPAEVSGLSKEIARLRGLPALPLYNDIETIPEIAAFIRQKNARIVEALAAQGIQAEQEYQRAMELLRQQNYVDALTVLLSLQGYADSAQLCEKLDKYYLISDVLEIDGKLYCFRKEGKDSLNLYATENGKIASKPLISRIDKILTNYADILYYLGAGMRLRCFNLATKTLDKMENKVMVKDAIYVHGHTVYMLQKRDNSYDAAPCDLVALDLATGQLRTVLTDVLKILSLDGNKMVYTVRSKEVDTATSRFPAITRVLNVDTQEVTDLGSQKLSVVGFVSDCVVYTREAYNDKNLDLYIQTLGSQEPARLLEHNIYSFCDIIAGKLFYYVGSARHKTLINVSCDGTDRKEWPMYISSLLFEQGGWLYFVRRAGYNSILCKSRMDGSRFSIIAADIDKFIEIKNGYLYYINDASALVKVRMDGSNQQTLCEHVETVLSVKEDRILFVSIDEVTGGGLTGSTKVVKSVYMVDFSGRGIVKLAYDVKLAKEYSENTIYYIASQKLAGEGSFKDILYRLNVDANKTEPLLQIPLQEEKSGGCYVATAVYGSYDCPQVWTLRRFRDTTLASTWYGRAFIHTYYAISPTLVKWFGKTRWFKAMWQGSLDRLVAKLQAQGVESTPYQDRVW